MKISSRYELVENTDISPCPWFLNRAFKMLSIRWVIEVSVVLMR